MAATAEFKREFLIRSLSACVFVPAILLMLVLGGWWTLILVLLVIGRCTWEFSAILATAGLRPMKFLSIAAAIGFGLWIHLVGTTDLLVAVLVAGMACLTFGLRGGTEGYLVRAFATFGAVLYLGLLGSTPLLIISAAGPDRTADAGLLLAAIFLCIWLTDSAAYLGGRWFGRRKLAPSISPGKTVAGFVAGTIGGLIPAALYTFVPFISLIELAGLLAVSGLAGQAGDLAESALKRDIGVKDAPAIIPGHGGALDRFDSYFFAFPAGYLYLKVIGLI